MRPFQRAIARGRSRRTRRERGRGVVRRAVFDASQLWLKPIRDTQCRKNLPSGVSRQRDHFRAFWKLQCVRIGELYAQRHTSLLRYCLYRMQIAREGGEPARFSKRGKRGKQEKNILKIALALLGPSSSASLRIGSKPAVPRVALVTARVGVVLPCAGVEN